MHEGKHINVFNGCAIFTAHFLIAEFVEEINTLRGYLLRFLRLSNLVILVVECFEYNALDTTKSNVIMCVISTNIYTQQYLSVLATYYILLVVGFRRAVKRLNRM